MAARHGFNAAATASLFFASAAILSGDSAFLLIVVVAAVLASILFLLGWQTDVSRHRHARGVAIAFSVLTVGPAAGVPTLPRAYPESDRALVTRRSFLFVPSVHAFSVLGCVAMSIVDARSSPTESRSQR